MDILRRTVAGFCLVSALFVLVSVLHLVDLADARRD